MRRAIGKKESKKIKRNNMICRRANIKFYIAKNIEKLKKTLCKIIEDSKKSGINNFKGKKKRKQKIKKKKVIKRKIIKEMKIIPRMKVKLMK